MELSRIAEPQIPLVAVAEDLNATTGVGAGPYGNDPVTAGAYKIGYGAGPFSPLHLPLVPGTVVIKVATGETFTDNGDGTLTGDGTPAGTGTINYATGEWSITLGAADAGKAITCDYNYFDSTKSKEFQGNRRVGWNMALRMEKAYGDAPYVILTRNGAETDKALFAAGVLPSNGYKSLGPIGAEFFDVYTSVAGVRVEGSAVNRL